jgi:predicted amidohydrolase YtcJ
LLIEHPQIYLDAQGRATDALLVRQGRVVATGAQARRLHEPGEERVEPAGACLFPALADAHCHLWGVGMRAGSVDLGGSNSPREVYDRLQSSRASQTDASPSGWVLGHSWDEYRWSGGDEGSQKTLHRRELDAIFPDTPVCLHRIDRHAIACNSEALRRASIGDDYSLAGVGCARRDVDGALTGVLVDRAMMPVFAAIPAASEAEDRRLFEESARILRSHGIASAHMALAGVARLPMLRAMAAAGELPIRVMAMVDGADANLADALAVGPVHDAEAWLTVATIKFFADGALGSMGAHLLEPYPDGTLGLVMHNPDELAASVAELIEAGWQVAVHAIGDAAARSVLDAFAVASPAMRREVRPRLEHAQMLTARDCRRLGELSTIASIQPIHLRSDATWAPNILGQTQLERLFPWRELLENSIVGRPPHAMPSLAAGSDYPIDDPNPWHGIATAMTRRTAAGDAFFPDKALTLHEILHAYTAGAAHAAHWESHLGKLDEGFVADIIALSRDPFDATPDEIWDMQVLRMWMGGENCAEKSDRRK